MVAPSVFDRRAEDFRECAEHIDRSDDDAFDQLERTMRSAGKTLFSCIDSGNLKFKEMPDWLQKRPRRTAPDTWDSSDDSWAELNGTWDESNIEYWATYWWRAVMWLFRNEDGSGIRIERQCFFPEPKDWIGLSKIICPAGSPTPPDKKLCHIWHGMAKASVDACHFISKCIKNAGSLPEQVKQPREQSEEPSPLQIGENQTVYYKGKTIRFGGAKLWDLFKKLYDAKGEVVTHEVLKELTNRDDLNVAIGELRHYLHKHEGKAIANAIKNQPSVGYRLNFEAL